MSAETVAYPDVVLTGPAQKSSVPEWMPFPAKVVESKSFLALDSLPELTVVRASGLNAVLKEIKFLKILGERHERSSSPSKVVFVFHAAVRPAAGPELSRLFQFFRDASGVEVATGAREAPSALQEAWGKILAERNRLAHSPGETDPLGAVKSILEATADLRADSGRLSAKALANAFDPFLTLSDFARLAGTTKQAVSKTPDAESLQVVLRPFERIARLRSALDKKSFATWLQFLNWQLENRTPLDVIRSGRADVVADLVEDMLTGSPS